MGIDELRISAAEAEGCTGVQTRRSGAEFAIHNSSFVTQSGITLIEMLVVVTIISLMVGVTFPAVSAGIDSIRMASAGDSIAAFLNAGLNRAERRREVVEVTVSKTDNQISLASSEPGFSRTLAMPEGVNISGVLPALPEETGERRFPLFPGGTVPRIGIEIVNRRGARRVVRIDPATGVAQIERAEQPERQ
jgi:prepilin-type N-terminal cleavage/methylation domain-containing protein